MPSGWTVERLVPLLGGAAVGATLLLGRTESPKWRGMTAFVAANLVMHGLVGWCPTSLLLEKLGIPRDADAAAARSEAGGA
ncbi:MAG: DUF2892 domain-containing protein [Nocardiaceae bacterium]|nr:DUF2892 domain-containing protein [Nocardiaceae bacterium]